MPRFPMLPSIVVLAAVATMIALGFWQLGRLEEKEALLARYQQAAGIDAPVAYPVGATADARDLLYRRSSIDCAFTAGDWQSVAGRSANGRSGYVHIIDCGTTTATTEADENAYVQAGWSPGPTPPEWKSGPVTGRIAPYSDGGVRLVADPPLGGLEASARPDPGDLPNNHLAYAVQWFLFALTALVIYVLALKRKQRGG